MLALCADAENRLKELKFWDHRIPSLFEQVKESLGNAKLEAPEDKLIESALVNIANGPTEELLKAEEQLLYKTTVEKTLEAMTIFLRALETSKNDACREIERKLFCVVFEPWNGGARVYPVYFMHDVFLQTQEPFVNFKSSTGSGKTRCAPFFFALRALHDDMSRPFCIMTQPGCAIIRDKMADFAEILGDSIELVDNVYTFEKMYGRKQTKPVMGLLTPHGVVKLLARASARGVDIVNLTRFALDEIHERSVDTDVLVALLGEKMAVQTFPLHLLMMSATPDPRVMNIFKHVEMFELPDSVLFPIRDIQKEAPDFGSIDGMACDTIFDILKDMANAELLPGHILVFTSGNQRIKRIMNLIGLSIEKECEGTKSKVKLLRELDFSSRQVCYDRIDAILAEDDESEGTLYILPIMYAGFVARDQQEIGKQSIPGHPNVIKIIVATNSIESSITIDGLAAVIDCGIRNEVNYDKERGIQNIVECPISVKSQIQRRGRVGRVRDGICVQITIKRHPPVELQPPSIQVEDISMNILNLRQIGIRLENIRNLPEPGVSSDDMSQYIRELVAIGALGDDHELTPEGRKLAAFTGMAPFLASAIVHASSAYHDSVIASLTGALIILLANTDNLVVDIFAEGLQNNFCEESDLFTIMASLLEVATSPDSYKKKLSEFGFNVRHGLKLIGTFEQISQNFGDRYEERKQVWTAVHEFYNQENMFDFVGKIFGKIGEVRKSWIECRQVTYKSVVDCLNTPQFVYQGSNVLIDGKDTEPEIFVFMRPGGKGFASPGACFLMQISKKQDGTLRGALIHKDSTRSETCHPVAVTTSSVMNNLFVDPMLRAYLGQDHGLRPFQKLRTNIGGKYGGFLFVPKYWNKTVVLSYTVADDEREEEMKKQISLAIAKVEKLMPFTPRCVLVKDDILKTIVAVSSFGAQNFTTNVYFYTDPCPAYKITKTSIDYLCEHITELSSDEANLVIAMTGEKFFCMDDPVNLDIPQARDSISAVFHPTARCHMVVMSKEEIPNMERLSWVGQDVYLEYSSGDALLHAANVIGRHLVRCVHKHDDIFAMKTPWEVMVDGNFPEIQDLDNNPSSIESVFDRYAMFCIKGQLLEQDVDLRQLRINSRLEGGLSKSMIVMNKFMKNHPSITKDQLQRVLSSAEVRFHVLPQLYERRDELSLLFRKGGNKRAIIAEQKEVNQKIRDLGRQLKETDEWLNEIGISRDDIKPLAQVNGPTEMLTIPGMFIYPGHYQTMKAVSECPHVIQILESCGYVVERVHLTDITITHLKRSGLTVDEFVGKVDAVCQRFGGIVKQKYPYHANEHHSTILGTILVRIYTSEFSIPFAGELHQALFTGGLTLLVLPSHICPPCLRGRKAVAQCIADWAQSHHLDLTQKGIRFFGNANEIDRALSLLSSTETRLCIPFKQHIIPGGINLDLVAAALQRMNRNLERQEQWALQRSMNAIFTPDNVEEKCVSNFLAQITQKYGKVGDCEILFDWTWCCGDEAVLSGSQIAIYHKDGSVALRNFCVTCCYDNIRRLIDRFYNESEDAPIIERLVECNERIGHIDTGNNQPDEWPVIPLGQFLMALTSEPLTQCVAKTWFTAIVFQALHNASRLEYCPEHPSVLMRSPDPGVKLKCSRGNCDFFLCPDCHRWHKGECQQEALIVPPGLRISPCCQKIVEKCGNCSDVECACGKHFCYYCGFGPGTGKQIYRHIHKEHGRAYSDPPDYRKYYLGESVSDEELTEFYAKYPKLKPGSGASVVPP